MPQGHESCCKLSCQMVHFQSVQFISCQLQFNKTIISKRKEIDKSVDKLEETRADGLRARKEGLD